MLPYRNNASSYSQLNTQDIPGALAGSKTVGNFHTTQRSQWRTINETGDIPGAQTGTLKIAPCTNRRTNPLNPQYAYLGQQDLGAKNINDPYGDGGSSMSNKFVAVQKQLESKKNKPTQRINDVVEDKKEFKKDMAKFYDVAQADTKEINLKDIHANPAAAEEAQLEKQSAKSGKENSAYNRPGTTSSV